VLLALVGGAIGVGAGVLFTAIYANTRHELVVIPTLAWGRGFGSAVLIGAVAGPGQRRAPPACLQPSLLACESFGILRLIGTCAVAISDPQGA
jgi:hypothetical protein